MNLWKENWLYLHYRSGDFATWSGFCFILMLQLRLHLSQLRMSAQYAILHKEESAHEEGIWCVAWATNPEDGSERIVTGGADGVVKVRYEILKKHGRKIIKKFA